MVKHLNIKVYGRVQGVFFRATAREQADKLGITGFAKNETDGSVYIEAEGEKEKLDEFVKWCKVGPTSAKVDDVKVELGSVKHFSEFIRDFADY